MELSEGQFGRGGAESRQISDRLGSSAEELIFYHRMRMIVIYWWSSLLLLACNDLSSCFPHYFYDKCSFLSRLMLMGHVYSDVFVVLVRVKWNTIPPWNGYYYCNHYLTHSKEKEDPVMQWFVQKTTLTDDKEGYFVTTWKIFEGVDKLG